MTRSTGAIHPRCSKVGNKPTVNVEKPMKMIEIRKVYLRSDQIAEAPEEHGAEGPNDEAGGIGRKRGEQRGRFVFRREKKLGEERREDRVEVKVIPFKDSACR